MTIRGLVSNAMKPDLLNFLVTNIIPRRFASHCVGRISRSENRIVCGVSLWLWRRFADLDLADADRTQFCSMHDCFTRRLKPGARPIDPDPAVIVSPCDAILGAHGTVCDAMALQVKGMPYALSDLLGDADHAAACEGGTFITLRLTSSMYHRFHAPHDCRIERVRHIFGDRWNVNPPTLSRVSRLFCRNERVVLRGLLLAGEQPMTLVAVGAILVSGIRLGFLPLHARAPLPVDEIYACDTVFAKGEEIGWFEHGSTIIVLLPRGMCVSAGLQEGDDIRLGQRLAQAV
jgi:phosphatidylserine decarboxylase